MKYWPRIERMGLIFICSFMFGPLHAHSINYALENEPVQNIFWFYLKLGIKHIIPLGYDHILFIVGICLISKKMTSILWQATAFTVAHSVTLALSMKNIIVAPAEIVEPVIAMSIMFVSVENMLLSEIKPWRTLTVFCFGLVHGMGFASALNETGLPPGQFYLSLISFNVGVEIAQIAVIVLVFLLLINPFSKKLWYRRFVMYPLSACIVMISLYWMVARLGE